MRIPPPPPERLGFTFQLDTALGVLHGVCSGRGVRCLTFDAAEATRAAGTLGIAAAGRPAPPDLAGEADAIRATLREYLAGRSRSLAVPVDLGLVVSPFQRAVLTALQAVPFGRSTSYGALAQAAGYPRGAARAVGQAVGRNPIILVVPCHRVLAGDGSLGGFSAGRWRKEVLLRLEGVRLPSGPADGAQRRSGEPAIEDPEGLA